MQLWYKATDLTCELPVQPHCLRTEDSPTGMSRAKTWFLGCDPERQPELLGIRIFVYLGRCVFCFLLFKDSKLSSK